MVMMKHKNLFVVEESVPTTMVLLVVVPKRNDVSGDVSFVAVGENLDGDISDADES